MKLIELLDSDDTPLLVTIIQNKLKDKVPIYLDCAVPGITTHNALFNHSGYIENIYFKETPNVQKDAKDYFGSHIVEIQFKRKNEIRGFFYKNIAIPAEAFAATFNLVKRAITSKSPKDWVLTNL